MPQKANIAILLGDPSGIGPELISKLLVSNEMEKANILVIGEKSILHDANKLTGNSASIEFVKDFKEVKFDGKTKFFLDISSDKNKKYETGKCSSESGKSVLKSLDHALELVKLKKINAINFGPFNKTSMKLAGSKYEDELHLMAEKLSVKSFFCEFNVIDNFWTARVTSHLPIKEVPSHIKKEKIIKPIKLINEAISLGIKADGPLPCDTSFITAFKNKNHDCIVGMYHDALQSGLKAFGFDRGVTVQGGLPIPITTPAHGTAFDIAGKNIANLEPTLQSFKIALKMSESLL